MVRHSAALHQAVLDGDHERLTSLLENGADPDQIGEDGAGALHLAAFSGNPAHVRSLLEAGADPDVRTSTATPRCIPLPAPTRDGRC